MLCFAPLSAVLCSSSLPPADVCVCARTRAWVGECVCERDRDRDRESVKKEAAAEGVCVSSYVCVLSGERKSVGI